jgi:hypothetical protein
MLLVCYLFALSGCFGGDLEDDNLVDAASSERRPPVDDERLREEQLLLDWRPDYATIVNPGGVCWSDDAFGGPGCQPSPQPPNECGSNSVCNTSPVSSCAGRCNYGYVCTANCTGTPTWGSVIHSSCNDPAYLPGGVDGLFYNPGPDLQCGTADDPANCSDGKNPGRDGKCDDGSHPSWNDDNY